MVDCLTQSAMKPLHDTLSCLLEKLPNDGTKNQELSFERARSRSILAGCSFGYDLSAATDRLPIKIQESILFGLLVTLGFPTKDSERLANLWVKILTDRPFNIPSVPQGVEDVQNLVGSDVYYTVGQPMGVLSSFNMLALTHHIIINSCINSCKINLYKSKVTWSELYEITGDDIVIFNEVLAEEYVKTMNSLGLTINLKKSVVSKHKAAGEYLKRTWIRDIDVGQISWKQIYQSESNLISRVSDSFYFIKKWRGHVPYTTIIRNCTYSYLDWFKPNKEKYSLSMLALLGIYFNASKTVIEHYIPFLFFQKEKEGLYDMFDYKNLVSLKIPDIRVVLDKFFETGKVSWETLSFGKNFLKRHEDVGRTYTTTIQKILITKINHIQEELFSSFIINTPEKGFLQFPCTEQELYSKVHRAMIADLDYTNFGQYLTKFIYQFLLLPPFVRLEEDIRRILSTFSLDRGFVGHRIRVFENSNKLKLYVRHWYLIRDKEFEQCSINDLYLIYESFKSLKETLEFVNLEPKVKEKDTKFKNLMIEILISSKRSQNLKINKISDRFVEDINKIIASDTSTDWVETKISIGRNKKISPLWFEGEKENSWILIPDFFPSTMIKKKIHWYYNNIWPKYPKFEFMEERTNHDNTIWNIDMIGDFCLDIKKVNANILLDNAESLLKSNHKKEEETYTYPREPRSTNRKGSSQPWGPING